MLLFFNLNRLKCRFVSFKRLSLIIHTLNIMCSVKIFPLYILHNNETHVMSDNVLSHC